jgi:hypothetical protein
VESHFVMACAAGKMLLLHAIHADKSSVKVESKIGSLLNRLIEIYWFYASISVLQCSIHINYGFIRVLSQTPIMGVFIPVHSICSILNPVLCNILPAADTNRCIESINLYQAI